MSLYASLGRKRRSGESSVGCRGKIRGAAIGKVRLRDSLECTIAGAAPGASEVTGREQRPVTALSEIGVSASHAHHGTPGESGVDIEDAAEGPAAGDLFHPTVAAVEEDRLVQAIELERFANVVVAAAVIQAEFVRVRLLGIRRGARVHALGPGELAVGHELVRELMLQFSQQSVVVTAA